MPGEHGVGELVADAQYVPGAHTAISAELGTAGLHDEPSLGHASAAFMPAYGQYWPEVHATAAAAPPAHSQLMPHRVGAVRPEPVHVKPTGHVVAVCMPTSGQYVPPKHVDGEPALAPHTEPRGQMVLTLPVQ